MRCAGRREKRKETDRGAEERGQGAGTTTHEECERYFPLPSLGVFPRKKMVTARGGRGGTAKREKKRKEDKGDGRHEKRNEKRTRIAVCISRGNFREI